MLRIKYSVLSSQATCVTLQCEYNTVDENFNKITEVMDTIPANICMLHFISHGVVTVPVIPSLDKFVELRTLYFKNIKGLKMVPNINSMVLYTLSINGCDIETLSNIGFIRSLVLKNNAMLDMATLPKTVYILRCINQNIVEFTIPKENTSTELIECQVGRITNIEVCVEYLATDNHYVFDMNICDSPYTQCINEYAISMDIPISNRMRWQCSQILPEVVNLILQINRQLRLDFGATMLRVTNAVALNTEPFDGNPIHTMFVLGSNYPRRMFEYLY